MEDLVIRPGVVIPADELHETFSRSGGPGGQHVNTSSTRVELRFDIAGSRVLDDQQKARLRARLASRLTEDGVLIVQSSQERSQLRNRSAARRRLAGLLADGLRPVNRRRPTRPSEAAKRRRVENKKQRGELKKLRRSPREP